MREAPGVVKNAGGGRPAWLLDVPLRRLSRVAVAALAMMLLSAVAALDWITGSELSFSIFYLVPVSLAAAYGGRTLGLATALLSAAAWLAVDVGGGQAYSSALIPVWNVGVRLGFFVITSLLVARIRTHIAVEERLARADGLTGAMNGRAFYEEGARLLQLARRHGHPFTVGYLDLDDFKRVNDRHGHAAGDRLLRGIAAGLRDAVRAQDLVARLGGDEFALLLPETAEAGTAAVMAKLEVRLRPVLAASGCAVGYSAGFITFTLAPATLEAAVAAADSLMYEVKAGGKGRVLQRTWSSDGDGERSRARVDSVATAGPPQAHSTTAAKEE